MPHVAFTAPHRTAAEVGLEILKAGGSAIEAMVAAAAAITVAYPHMSSLGGDGFWLVLPAGGRPFAIDAAGVSAARADLRWLREAGLAAVPNRGGRAVITLGGAVAGWQLALESLPLRGRLPLKELLEPARELARGGVTVTDTFARATAKLHGEALASGDKGIAHCRATFGERPLASGARWASAELADTFGQLIHAGLDDYYRGDLGHALAAGYEAMGSPLTAADLQSYRARAVPPLRLDLKLGTALNLPPPTQGIASLLILALYERCGGASSLQDATHLLVEATKQAFTLRDHYLADSGRMQLDPRQWLEPEYLDRLAAAIGARAAPWPRAAAPGDTVWLGCLDRAGNQVSYIQSVYWEFGAGVVVPGLGIVASNRGACFNAEPQHSNCLAPGVRPRHTLNPAALKLPDGRRLVYGTMGGDGQPQTQAQLVYRLLGRGEALADAVAAPRWLLGRTWGEQSLDLKLEQPLFERLGEALARRGHRVAMVPEWSECMGHAGALMHWPDGRVEVATDPRSDGAALTANVR